jgi:hypothetical protein
MGVSNTFNTDLDSRIRVSVEPRKTGDSKVIVTHNWCDKTTWYQDSQRITDEELMTEDNITYSSVNTHWIDLVHGKVYRENLIASNYLPVLRVNDEVVERRPSWTTAGGDYEVDYEKGTVQFFEAQSGVVTADYSCASGSCFTLAPSSGKARLWVEYSEIQFGEDLVVNSTLHFQPWAYNPYDYPNKIACCDPTSYATIDNYIEEANGCYPPIPTFSGERGISVTRHTFPFKYSIVKELHSSQGLEIRIWVEDDIVFGGTYATATFYCTEYDDCPEHL